jgi:DNA-binding transcriptional LysR family regulator
MDFRKLRNFVVLAEEQIYSRAAEQVHLTQPALSRSIIALEDELGARLFDRSNNNVLLTPIGKILLTRAQSLLFDLGRLKQEVRLMAEGETGEISMGVGPYPGSTLMPLCWPNSCARNRWSGRRRDQQPAASAGAFAERTNRVLRCRSAFDPR